VCGKQSTSPTTHTPHNEADMTVVRKSRALASSTSTPTASIFPAYASTFFPRPQPFSLQRLFPRANRGPSALPARSSSMLSTVRFASVYSRISNNGRLTTYTRTTPIPTLGPQTVRLFRRRPSLILAQRSYSPILRTHIIIGKHIRTNNGKKHGN
jgi:hypothetical protein